MPLIREQLHEISLIKVFTVICPVIRKIINITNVNFCCYSRLLFPVIPQLWLLPRHNLIYTNYLLNYYKIHIWKSKQNFWMCATAFIMALNMNRWILFIYKQPIKYMHDAIKTKHYWRKSWLHFKTLWLLRNIRKQKFSYMHINYYLKFCGA